jgi:hypothetical protein
MKKENYRFKLEVHQTIRAFISTDKAQTIHLTAPGLDTSIALRNL